MDWRIFGLVIVLLAVDVSLWCASDFDECEVLCEAAGEGCVCR